MGACCVTKHLAAGRMGRPCQRGRAPHAAGHPQHSLALAEAWVPGGSGKAVYIGRSLNANEVVEADDTVVVLGDCRLGTTIRSEGSIIVLGRLLGEVHAGSAGDAAAVVTASDMQPARIRIAHVTTNPARLHRDGNIYGKLAYLSQGGDSGAAIKVVPMARPFLHFGPSSPQLLKAESESNRTEAAEVARATGLYAMTLGLVLIVAPAAIFHMLFEPGLVSPGFIRLGGALLFLFGLYYAGASRGSRVGTGLSEFFRATVGGRYALAALCVVLVGAGELGMGMLFFAVMNAAGAFAMQRAMKRDADASCSM